MVAKIGVIAWFNANRDYVATELCENKNAPEKKCAGKCYLKKQLNKIEQGSDKSKQLPEKKHKTEFSEFITSVAPHFAISFFTQSQVSAVAYTDNYSFNCSQSIFHPPPVC